MVKVTSAVLFLSLLEATDGFAGLGSIHRSRSGSTSLSMSSALIVQNKGGGHGELGYQLAKKLSSSPTITSITILQDDACDDTKEPFKSYASDLPNVKVVKASLADESMTADDMQKVLGESESYDFVFDNASKKPEGAGKAVCDCAKSWGTKAFTYVSSAGMYQPTDETVFPMEETTPIKESAGQALFDAYAVEIGLPLVSFRPQYIYGEKSNKNDYIDWYFDRLVRNLPLPIPGDGTQKVSLTNSAEVATLLSCVVENPEAAIEQRFFNCGTDKLYSYDEVAYVCAEAAGIAKEDVKIEHYNADLGKAKFPFRLTDFYVAPDIAKAKIGFSPTYSLEGDIQWYYDGYKARGADTKDLDTSKDQEVLS